MSGGPFVDCQLTSPRGTLYIELLDTLGLFFFAALRTRTHPLSLQLASRLQLGFFFFLMLLIHTQDLTVMDLFFQVASCLPRLETTILIQKLSTIDGDWSTTWQSSLMRRGGDKSPIILFSPREGDGWTITCAMTAWRRATPQLSKHLDYMSLDSSIVFVPTSAPPIFLLHVLSLDFSILRVRIYIHGPTDWGQYQHPYEFR